MERDVILSKIEKIERCIGRVNAVYQGHESEIRTDYDRQDAIILNLQRACQTTIDLAMYVVKVNRLGIPQSTAEAFKILVEKGALDPKLGDSLRKMVGFRNIAIHEYSDLNYDVIENVIVYGTADIKLFLKWVLGLLKSDSEKA